jgi:pentatricopeptide repeat protein
MCLAQFGFTAEFTSKKEVQIIPKYELAVIYEILIVMNSLNLQMLVKARKVREAMAVLNEMLKNECLPTHANCLLAFDTKDPDLCIKVWQCMFKHGIHPLQEAGNSLVSLLNRLDLLPEACKYAEDLIDSGVKLSSYNLAELKRSLKKVHKDKIHDHLLLKWKQHQKVGI